MARRLPLTLMMLAVAVLVGACGGSSNTAATGTRTHTVTVTHTVTAGGSTQTGTTTTRTTTTTSTAQSGPAACVAADLTPLSLGSNGAAGTVVYGFALRNTSGRRCHTYGWPGASFLSAGGSMLPTDVTRTTHDIAGDVKPTAIMLSPGQEASFRISVSEAYQGGANCKPASFLQIFAPDDTVAMRVAISGGAQACGRATVTPLQPGSAAFVR